jgi:hypothetical protein
MKINIHDLTIYRGETFTICKSLQNRDGTPYIISDSLGDGDAYFLISIVSSTYSQDKKYEKNYWLSLKNFPRFTETVPIALQDLDNIHGTFDDIVIKKDNDVYYFEATINGEYAKIPASYAVYYDKNYPNVYKYIDSDGKWSVYECKIVKTFSREDSEELVSKNYKYSIQLIYGNPMKQYLQSLANSNKISYVIEDPTRPAITREMTNSELATELINNGILSKDFDFTKPLSNIYTAIPILEPCTINVINYK